MFRLSVVAVGLMLSGAAMAEATEPTPALSVEEIVRRHVAAKGGAEAIAAIRSTRLVGSYVTFGDAAPFEVLRQRPQHYRFDFRQLGRDVTYGFDGEKAWWTNPVVTGLDWAVTPPAAEQGLLLSESQFDNPLIDAAGRGITLRFDGAGDLDGVATLVVVATLPGGREERWHLDPVTFLEVARETKGADFGAPAAMRSYFSDLRPVAGVMFPHVIEDEFATRLNRYEISSIEINPTLEAGLFRFPVAPEVAAIAGLAGRWQVAISSRPYPNAPLVETTTTSAIASRFEGRVLSEDIVVETAGGTSTELRTWAWDRFRSRWSLVVYDDVGAYANVLWGTRRDDGAIVFDNVGSGTSFVVGEAATLTRYILEAPTEAGFRIVTESSSDAGVTWTPGYESTYKPAGE